MSDGSSGNAFGEALESMATNTKKAIGGTIADFTKSAVGQVKGNPGISGSFTPGSSQSGSKPQAESSPSLSGGDLFSPDLLAGQAKKQQQSTQSLVQSSQQSGQDPNAKSPEEAAKIQSIQQELRTMHQAYYQDFLAKAEGRDKKTKIEKQEKAQDDQQQKMEEMQKEDKKKQESTEVFRAKRSSEIKGGLG